LKRFKNIVLLLFFIPIIGFTQNNNQSFFKPSDSLNYKKQKIVIASEAISVTGGFIGLNELWYKNYPKSDFHFINDNHEWLQMDKMGHLFSSYHLGKTGVDLLNWSGSTKNQQLIYGATLGFVFLTGIEILDGYSQKWGASAGDILANSFGTGLYVSQELIWKEQRIIPKFSFHPTNYAQIRPEILGSNFSEQILKDYNGQTYWLSFNLDSFFKNKNIPKILNIAFGFGAEGMISGNNDFIIENSTFSDQRQRQFYLSLDLNLTNIQTKSHFLKTIFSVINILKIPAPTIEITSGGVVNFYCLYF
jgi:hypothetical protein